MYIVNIVHRAPAKSWEERHRISVIQMSILKVLRQDHPWLTMLSIWQIIDFIMPPKVRIVWMENQMKSGWHFLLAITLASERSVAMMIWNTFRHLRISNIETGFGYRNGYRMVGFEHEKNISTRLNICDTPFLWCTFYCREYLYLQGFGQQKWRRKLQRGKTISIQRRSFCMLRNPTFKLHWFEK